MTTWLLRRASWDQSKRASIPAGHLWEARSGTIKGQVLRTCKWIWSTAQKPLFRGGGEEVCRCLPPPPREFTGAPPGCLFSTLWPPRGIPAGFVRGTWRCLGSLGLGGVCCGGCCGGEVLAVHLALAQNLIFSVGHQPSQRDFCAIKVVAVGISSGSGFPRLIVFCPENVAFGLS